MKGWEVYANDWGCGSWTPTDNSYFIDDWVLCNIVLTWVHPSQSPDKHWLTSVIHIRQPTPVQVLADERRLRCQIKLMQSQWRRALYDPTQAVCKKRIEAEFHNLSAEEDRIECNGNNLW